MSVHVRGTDGDIAADPLWRVHVGIVRGVVGPVHPQHCLLHHLRLDYSVAKPGQKDAVCCVI